MRELQALVLQEWVRAGGDRRESLMMECVDASGGVTKVSKGTDFASVASAATLNLLPKHLRTKCGGASASARRYGRVSQQEMGSANEDGDGDSARVAAGLD